jgi:hypothetical protein
VFWGDKQLPRYPVGKQLAGTGELEDPFVLGEPFFFLEEVAALLYLIGV